MLPQVCPRRLTESATVVDSRRRDEPMRHRQTWVDWTLAIGVGLGGGMILTRLLLGAVGLW